MDAGLVRAILPGMPKSLTAPAAKLLGLDELRRTYESIRQSRGIAQALLGRLQVEVLVADSELARIPKSGPCVVVSNHPRGILDGAVLISVLQRVRSDVRVLANEILASIPEVEELVIPVDVFHGSRRNSAGLRAAMEHLESGGLLLVFPAGAVSHFLWSKGESQDPEWRANIVRLIRMSKAKPLIAPVFLDGTNSFLFHAAGMVHPLLRTAMLARELNNKRRSTALVRIGKPVDPDKLAAFASDAERIEYLRWRTYLLGSGGGPKAQTSKPLRRRFRKAEFEPVAEGIPSARLEQDIRALPAESLLAASGDLVAYLATADRLPHVLPEIGRLREVTFRAAGEGTGRSTDLDRFDDHYWHLFLWNRKLREVAGAYRLKGSEFGPQALYTNTLFRFGQEFLDRMGPALELGRSFIRAEYQKGFAPLLLLWKGIGKFVARHPRYKVLFGPVSISNQYQAMSRELMISFLEQRASLEGWMRLVRPRHAPARLGTPMLCSDLEELAEVVSDVEARDTGVPVLLRQYLKLGGKLLSFNVDPDFSNALDGLIVVDLTRTAPNLLDRYLGKEESAAFLAYQKGNYGTL
jgi:putative hemolysin